MQVVPEVLGTLVPTVAIKDSEIANGDLVVQAQVLDALVRVFHALALTNVTHVACIEPLDLKLKLAYPKRVVWLKDKFFVRLKASVDSA